MEAPRVAGSRAVVRPPLRYHREPMISTRRALQFARLLALGSAASATTMGCERNETAETPNTFSSGTSAANTPDTGVGSTGNTDPTTPNNAGTSPTSSTVVAGGACTTVGARDSEYRPMGLVPCECVAQSGGARWVCNERDMVIEGPLPPPELACTKQSLLA